jgi:hypothetical protein
MFGNQKAGAVTAPTRGKVRALALTGGGTQDNFDLNDVFTSSAWADGEFVTLQSDVPVYIQFSTALGDTISSSATGVADDTATALIYAGEERRWLIPGQNRYMHAIGAAAGKLRIWRGSAKDV